MIGIILRLLGILLFSVLALFFGIYILAFLSFFLIIFLVAWVFGLPITIKESGKKVGYVRWFTFHRN